MMLLLAMSGVLAVHASLTVDSYLSRLGRPDADGAVAMREFCSRHRAEFDAMQFRDGEFVVVDGPVGVPFALHLARTAPGGLRLRIGPETRLPPGDPWPMRLVHVSIVATHAGHCVLNTIQHILDRTRIGSVIVFTSASELHLGPVEPEHGEAFRLTVRNPMLTMLDNIFLSDRVRIVIDSEHPKHVSLGTSGGVVPIVFAISSPFLSVDIASSSGVRPPVVVCAQSVDGVHVDGGSGHFVFRPSGRSVDIDTVHARVLRLTGEDPSSDHVLAQLAHLEHTQLVRMSGSGRVVLDDSAMALFPHAVSVHLSGVLIGSLLRHQSLGNVFELAVRSGEHLFGWRLNHPPARCERWRVPLQMADLFRAQARFIRDFMFSCRIYELHLVQKRLVNYMRLETLHVHLFDDWPQSDTPPSLFGCLFDCLFDRHRTVSLLPVAGLVRLTISCDGHIPPVIDLPRISKLVSLDMRGCSVASLGPQLHPSLTRIHLADADLDLLTLSPDYAGLLHLDNCRARDVSPGRNAVLSRISDILLYRTDDSQATRVFYLESGSTRRLTVDGYALLVVIGLTHIRIKDSRHPSGYTNTSMQGSFGGRGDALIRCSVSTWTNTHLRSPGPVWVPATLQCHLWSAGNRHVFSVPENVIELQF